MKKIFLTALMAFAFGASAFAQEAPAASEQPLAGSHLYLGARLGAAEFMMRSNFAGENFTMTNKLGLGISADVNYAYFFTPHFGLRTGLNLTQVNNSRMRFENYDRAIPATVGHLYDPAHGIYEQINSIYTYTAAGDETYTATYFEIPLQLAFQGNHWYANCGVKYALPFKAFNARKSYDAIDFYYGATTPGAGVADVPTVYEQSIVEVGGDYNYRDFVKPNFWLGALEFGYRFGCDCGNSWMLGVYADFSINAINCAGESMENEFVAINVTGANNEHHNFTRDLAVSSDVIDHFRMMDFGVKLQYDFGFRRNK